MFLYESMIISSGVDGIIYDEEKIKEVEHQILYELCKFHNLVLCIKAMMRNQLEYT